MKHLLFACLLITAFCAQGQNPEKPRLITGPVLGAVTSTTANIWICYKGNGQTMMTIMDTADKTMYFPSGFHKINNSRGLSALTMEFKDLKPGRVYKPVFANPLTIHPKCVFTTPADTALEDFDFLFGSCALMNTDFSRFMLPGAAVNIFNVMKKQHSRFMVWLGDNIYYLGKQYTSYDRMFMRNLNVRTGFIELREFLASTPNYATWDDHDYGWNDSDKKFPFKDSSLVIFKGFWPNPYPVKQPFKGNYFTFKYQDAEFFMTDDRFYRDSPGDTAGDFFGNAQIDWLKDALLNSKATFKFLIVGSQVLDDSYWGESYAKYPKERNDLFDFIAANNIKGVILLTGDRHYAELSKRNWKGYTLYDFTSSPLTSVVINYRHVKGYHNTYNVPGSLFYKRNFGKIALSGPAGNRVCKLELYSNVGKRLWSYDIKSSELETNAMPVKQK
jgi:alkaline phosphatase D